MGCIDYYTKARQAIMCLLGNIEPNNGEIVVSFDPLGGITIQLNQSNLTLWDEDAPGIDVQAAANTLKSINSDAIILWYDTQNNM